MQVKDLYFTDRNGIKISHSVPLGSTLKEHNSWKCVEALKELRSANEDCNLDGNCDRLVQQGAIDCLGATVELTKRHEGTPQEKEILPQPQKDIYIESLSDLLPKFALMSQKADRWACMCRNTRKPSTVTMRSLAYCMPNGRGHPARVECEWTLEHVHEKTIAEYEKAMDKLQQSMEAEETDETKKKKLQELMAKQQLPSKKTGWRLTSTNVQTVEDFTSHFHVSEKKQYLRKTTDEKPVYKQFHQLNNEEKVLASGFGTFQSLCAKQERHQEQNKVSRQLLGSKVITKMYRSVKSVITGAPATEEDKPETEEEEADEVCLSTDPDGNLNFAAGADEESEPLLLREVRVEDDIDTVMYQNMIGDVLCRKPGADPRGVEKVPMEDDSEKVFTPSDRTFSINTDCKKGEVLLFGYVNPGDEEDESEKPKGRFSDRESQEDYARSEVKDGNWKWKVLEEDMTTAEIKDAMPKEWEALRNQEGLLDHLCSPDDEIAGHQIPGNDANTWPMLYFDDAQRLRYPIPDHERDALKEMPDLTLEYKPDFKPPCEDRILKASVEQYNKNVENAKREHDAEAKRAEETFSQGTWEMTFSMAVKCCDCRASCQDDSHSYSAAYSDSNYYGTTDYWQCDKPIRDRLITATCKMSTKEWNDWKGIRQGHTIEWNTDWGKYVLNNCLTEQDVKLGVALGPEGKQNGYTTTTMTPPQDWPNNRDLCYRTRLDASLKHPQMTSWKGSVDPKNTNSASLRKNTLKLKKIKKPDELQGVRNVESRIKGQKLSARPLKQAKKEWMCLKDKKCAHALQCIVKLTLFALTGCTCHHLI